MNRFFKFLFVSAIFCLVTKNIFANRIDSLKTDSDVLEFLKSINEDFRSEKYQKIELRTTETLRQELDCDGVANQLQVNNWEKADFNGDGKTDLLVIPYWYDYGVYVVIDNGDGTFKLLTLSYNIYEKCELAKPIKKDNQQLLLFYEKKQTKTSKGIKSINVFDTLVYKYGGFVEMNSFPSQYDIDSIEFQTSACFGSCPIFSIAFDNAGNAVYNAGVYNPKQGRFTATLKKENFTGIFSLVNYLSVKKLSDDYKVTWTDDQTCWLTVKFKDGSVKTIKDYGLKGTFGLRLLYSMFFDLRSIQDWK